MNVCVLLDLWFVFVPILTRDLFWSREKGYLERVTRRTCFFVFVPIFTRGEMDNSMVDGAWRMLMKLIYSDRFVSQTAKS